MIILPLGFGRKIPRIPWITVGIAIAMTAISISQFPRISKLEQVQAAALTQAHYQKKLIPFVQRHCPLTDLDREQCATVRDVLPHFLSADKTKSKVIEARLRKMITQYPTLKPHEIESKIENATGYLHMLLKNPRGLAETASTLPEYQSVISAYDEATQALDVKYRDIGLLTPRNKGVGPLMYAQWLHAGWSHLIGNLVCFVLLAAVLEARIGMLPLMVMYILGGTIGLWIELMLFKNPLSFLLGASANISAIHGAFFVFFFHRPMRALFTMVVYNKLIDIPTWLIIPVVFLFADFSGVLGGEEGVAHLAHLSGFVFGALFAFLYKWQDGLPQPYLYQVEYDWHVEMRTSVQLSKGLEIAEQILKYNESNYRVIEDALASIVKTAQRSGEMIDVRARDFFARYAGAAISMAVDRKSVQRVESILNSLPKSIPLVGTIDNVSQKKLIALGEKQLKEGNWFLAFRIYDVFRFNFPKTSGSQAIEKSMRKMFTHLSGKGADLSKLGGYRLLEPKTTFANLLTELDLNQLGDAHESAS